MEAKTDRLRASEGITVLVNVEVTKVDDEWSKIECTAILYY